MRYPRLGAAALRLLLPGILVGSIAIADVEKVQLRNELGITYVKEGHLEDGLRSFMLTLSEDPNNAAALNNAGNVYSLQGETARALELYKKAVAAKPDEGGIHLNLGILLHRMGKESDGSASIRRGLELVGDLQEAYYLLGLSRRPPGERSSQHGAVEEAEITQLLELAWMEVPARKKASRTDSGDKGQETRTSTVQASGSFDASAERDSLEGSSRESIKTRPGGAKASQIEMESGRLFWMRIPKKP